MRKWIKYLVLAFVLLVFGILALKIAIGYKSKKKAEENIQNLPSVSFKNLQGQWINLQNYNPYKPIVIIYFHPGCEHCQYEAREMGLNASAFKNTQLVMVSAIDSVKILEKFVSEYHLTNLENFEMLIDSAGLFKKTFGKAIVPSVYIYLSNRKLKKKFLGETKIEAIIDNLNEN